MTAEQALKKYGIRKKAWELFLCCAASNGRMFFPSREKGERRDSHIARIEQWFNTTPAWAYVGGMRDALAAWVQGDQEAYAALEPAFNEAVASRIPEAVVPDER